MKKLLLFLSFIGIPIAVFSQVGIGTDTPTAMLDVAGLVRVRNTPVGTTRQAQDSILVVDGHGYLRTVSSHTVENSSLTSFIKGRGSAATSILTVNIIPNWRRIAFNTIEIDNNSSGNYNTTTYQFTAPETGIYQVYGCYTLNDTSILSIGANVGIGIFKQVGSNTPVLVAEDTSTVLGALGISVTSPIRQVNTLVSLNQGETIFFGAQVPIAITALSASTTGNYFTITQVH